MAQQERDEAGEKALNGPQQRDVAHQREREADEDPAPDERVGAAAQRDPGDHTKGGERLEGEVEPGTIERPGCGGDGQQRSDGAQERQQSAHGGVGGVSGHGRECPCTADQDRSGIAR